MRRTVEIESPLDIQNSAMRTIGNRGKRSGLIVWAALTVCVVLFPIHGASAQAEEKALAEEVQQLVRDLESDRLEARDVAEKKLLKLAGDTVASGDRLIDLLPQVDPQMSPSLQTRLSRIRQKIDERMAHAAVGATRVTLDAKDMPLDKVLEAIEEQTGNRLLDYREAFGQESPPIEVTLTVKSEPFWQAVDKLLDQANLTIYGFADEGGLPLVARPPGMSSRVGNASYVGPFRIEATGVQARRDFRQIDNQGLAVGIEIAWEPRLQPIVLSQPLAEIFATDKQSQALPVPDAEQSLDVEVQAGSPSTDLTIPFDLPDRTTPAIALLRGTMQALVPGRVVKFEFDDIDQPKPQTKHRSGVGVTLDRIKREDDILEVHMRVRLDQPGEALASHRGWIFQNPSYLVDKDGNQIENAGFETTLQNETEVGLIYLFDVTQPNEDLTWAYETPAAVIEMPVPYELREIRLP